MMQQGSPAIDANACLVLTHGLKLAMHLYTQKQLHSPSLTWAMQNVNKKAKIGMLA